ncbi:MAG TPA: hypothetical protein VKJ65_01365 [Phycisphaerae bacterium]|nr:hypothetical protein [Phycisphaerae bacterium]
MRTVVHVTHEAVQKIGGIGAVLHGLLTSKNYSAAVDRNILVGPLFSTDGPAESRLGPGSELYYSSIDGIRDHVLAPALEEVEKKYSVRLVYGRKTFFDKFTGVESRPEVLLIDVHQYNQQRMGAFKWKLYEEFGIESNRYEWIWDYEQYCRIAEPTIETLTAIGCTQDAEPVVILSHEYMGMPTVLAALLHAPSRFRTIFYAHEVAPMRRIVESHPGHDLTFYNALRICKKEKQNVNDAFGPQSFFYKYPLVDAARYCDNIFAVGDYIIDEFHFLDHVFEKRRIDRAYNGVPAFQISLKEKLVSRARLQQYCENLLGFRPDFVFTHVTRLVLSKGLWRDLKVMYHLENLLRKNNQTAVLIVLSTETMARRADDVRNMEMHYKWPVAHREGHPDLTGGEAGFYSGVQEFNARGRSCKVIYINQFGFDRRTCGERVPAEMEFMDIRQGSDLEFGQSIYEPFGIAQIEPISFGGICVFTSLCGCAGFTRQVLAGKKSPNVLEVDYTIAPELKLPTVEDCLALDRQTRDLIESHVATRAAEEIFRRLPQTEQQFDRMLQQGYELASQMSWEVVARDYVLPGIQRAIDHRREKILPHLHRTVAKH